MTSDRLIHLLAGCVLLWAFVKLTKMALDWRGAVWIMAAAMGAGTWVPDWDLLFGIGYHRSPLTHSILPAALVGWGVRRGTWAGPATIGFAVGLASHLLWDIVDYGNVQWIDGGNRDRLFLLANAGFALGLAGTVRVKSRSV